jgi:hypothetical protein
MLLGALLRFCSAEAPYVLTCELCLDAWGQLGLGLADAPPETTESYDALEEASGGVGAAGRPVAAEKWARHSCSRARASREWTRRQGRDFVGRAMAIAFIQINDHPAAYPFYKDFAPKEPISPSGEMKLTKFHKTKALSALDLLKIIGAKATKGSEILIVTHGTDHGLILPLTPGNSTYLEQEPITIFFDTSVSRADKKAKLQVTETELEELEKAQKKVKKLALKRVEFRACHVGGDPKTLEALRDFFGARAAGAPDLDDAYTSMPSPYTGSTNSWWTTNTSAVIETMSGGGRVGYVLLNLQVTSFNFQWAVDDAVAQKEWVKKKYPLGKAVARPKAIHGMIDGAKLIFPGDTAYRTHLKST